MGYNAVYPGVAIAAHRAFIARRRSLRSAEEYRAVTPEQWDEFLGHFERRKLALWDCLLWNGLPHEHSCIRCPVLIVSADERAIWFKLCQNLADRIAEAERKGWVDDVEGLSLSRAAAEEEIAQIDARRSASSLRPSSASPPSSRPPVAPQRGVTRPAPRASHLLTSLAKDTELITFGVCQYNPRLITLANISTLRAMSHQTSHLGVLVIRPEVEMQSALNLLALIKPDEVQPRQAIRLRADLELLIGGVDHNPTKSRSPPLPQGHRIYRMNNYLFPLQGHPPSLTCQGFRSRRLVRRRGRYAAKRRRRVRHRWEIAGAGAAGSTPSASAAPKSTSSSNT